MPEFRVYFSNRSKPVVANEDNNILYHYSPSHNVVALFDESNPAVAIKTTERIQPGQKFVLVYTGIEHPGRRFVDTCYTVERVVVVQGPEYDGIRRSYDAQFKKYRNANEKFYEKARSVEREAKKTRSKSKKSKLLAEAENLHTKAREESAKLKHPSLAELVLLHVTKK